MTNYKEKIPQNFFSKENIKSRWMSNLSEIQTLMIEEMLDDIFRIYKYKKLISQIY